MPGYPGQIHANIGTVRTNVTFDHRDCGVTLLKNDHVLINLLIDTVTRKRRAANIRPKVPFTFAYTKEERELVTAHTADPVPPFCSVLVLFSQVRLSFRASSPRWGRRWAS